MNYPLTETTAPRPATGPRRHCLFGVTILLVEDSRGVSEAVRLFAAESGARLRRADSLASASRHLAIYRPNAVIIDLGLPDGDGLALIRHLAAAATPLRSIIAMSGHDPAAWQPAARAAGAVACLEKPIPSLRAFQDTVLSVLPDAAERRIAEGAELSLDGRASMRAAFDADLRRARTLLSEAIETADRDMIVYCAQFIGSLGDMIPDAGLAAAARATNGPGPRAHDLVLRVSDRIAGMRTGAPG